MNPDFLIIPKMIHHDKKLRPTDWIVYAVIYWYEHMKEGRCFASNESIADIARVSERAVMSSLERLEIRGYIKREYNENKSRRTEIRSMVHYTKNQTSTGQVNLPGISSPGMVTPGEFAKRFFAGDDETSRLVLENLLLKTEGRGEQKIKEELLKFIVYWTEPNKSGTKVRWQLQETFDIYRRIYNWLSKSSTFKSFNRSGSGVDI